MPYSTNVGRQIASILEVDGVGTFGTNLFVSKKPNNPDSCVTIYNTGGIPDNCISDLDSRSGELSNFQITVRDNGYENAWAKMESVRDSLEKQQRLTNYGGGTTYITMWLNSLPNELQRDTTNRALITASFTCIRHTDPLTIAEIWSSTPSDVGFATNVAYQVAQLLETNGVGTFATDIFVSREPNDPDDCVTVYNTGGLPDECISDRNARSGEVNNFQVRVRNNDYEDAWAKMEECRDVLEKKLKTIVLSDERIHFRIWELTLPNELQRDTTNRALITANFACMRWVDLEGFSSSSSSSSEGTSSSSSSSSEGTSSSSSSEGYSESSSSEGYSESSSSTEGYSQSDSSESSSSSSEGKSESSSSSERYSLSSISSESSSSSENYSQSESSQSLSSESSESSSSSSGGYSLSSDSSESSSSSEGNSESSSSSELYSDSSDSSESSSSGGYSESSISSESSSSEGYSDSSDSSESSSSGGYSDSSESSSSEGYSDSSDSSESSSSGGYSGSSDSSESSSSEGYSLSSDSSESSSSEGYSLSTDSSDSSSSEGYSESSSSEGYSESSSSSENYSESSSSSDPAPPPPEAEFIIKVKTDNTGTSNNDQFTIALNPAETYDFTATYDGTSTDHSTSTDLTLTFPSGAGTYSITITGTFPAIYMNNGKDELKLIEVEQWGNSYWTTMVRSFYGCENMTITASDLPDLRNVTSMQFAFAFCNDLTSFPLMDTSNVENFSQCWRFCTSMTSFPLIDTSSGTNFNDCFESMTSLTSFPLLDMSSALILNECWRGNTGLTSFPNINTGSVTDFAFAWYGCTGLNGYDFPTLDMSSMTNGANTFTNVTLSTTSWSDLLVDVEANNVNTGVQFWGGNSLHNSSGATAITALEARDPAWTIVDGGSA